MRTNKLLFKYVNSVEAIVSMLSGGLKFTPPPNLNDPMEMRPSVTWDEIFRSLEQLRAKGFDQQKLEALQQQACLLDRLAPGSRAFDAPRSIEEANRVLKRAVYENETIMLGYLNNVASLIRRSVGVLSLTTNETSFPMWAHYGSEGEGFVACFRDLESAFPKSTVDLLSIPKMVSYDKNPCGLTFDPDSAQNLFFSKHTDWAYEREWRVVLPLDECRLLGGANIHIYDVPEVHCIGVICGWKTRTAIIEDLKSKFSVKQIIPTELKDGQILKSEDWRI